MLFIAIGMSSTGIAMKSTFEKTLKFQTPFDMTIYELTSFGTDKRNIDEKLNEIGIDINKYSKELVDYKLYKSDISNKQIFKNTNDPLLKQQIKTMMDFNIPIIKLSEYNKLKELKGEESVDLKDDEVLLLTDMGMMKGAIEDYISNNKYITINNQKLKVKDNYEYTAIETSPVSMNGLTIILDDKNIQNLEIEKSFISFNYKGDKLKADEEILKEFKNKQEKFGEEPCMFISYMSKSEAFENNMAASNMFLFVGIYIGIVFLIASAAVLSLSQLSGATESIERYKVLRKLGVSTEMINKSIFIQVLLYFVLPIGLALVHSIFGIKVANELVKVFGDYDIVGTNIFTIVAILIVYGIYFIATYNGYKRTVNNNQ